jgi:hypothetical protein
MKSTDFQRRVLNEIESRELLKQYEITQNQFDFAPNKKIAIDKSNQIGFPVVLKVVSEKIVHKSNYGGVKVGLKNIEEVANAFDQIMASAQQHGVALKDIDGVTVQEMVSGVEELLIGAKRDPVFGPIIVIGFGGVLVELMNDVSLGILPLSKFDIEQMLTGLKGYQLLTGYRGRDMADIPSFIKLIKRVEVMMLSENSIFELDLNPVIIHKNNEGCIVVDARIVIHV